MKISYNWLRQFIDTELDANALAEKITSVGLEVEDAAKYSSLPETLSQFTIGEVKEVWKHPNADKLRVTKVDIGSGELLQIVCGAPNVAEGQRVAVATVGTRVCPLQGEPFQIKASKIRGEKSEGMICAEDELGLNANHEGILVLGNEAEIGKPLTSYFVPYKDYTIEIGLTPNRADAASHIGVARDLAALFGQKIKYPPLYSHFQQFTDASNGFSVQIEEPEMCPRYSGAILRNIKVHESPDWLKNALRTVGLNPINNIVDATNFVMYECGQPLHAFDLNKIKGNKIIVKKAEEGAVFVTLDKQERKLNGTELMICNAEKPMAIAGVFGGLESGITSETTTIFIESAYFSPFAIRNTSRRHGLFTDASFRYERGADPNITVAALQRVADIILQTTTGEIETVAFDVYPKPILPQEINLPFAMVDKISGMQIPREEIKAILNGLEINILREDEAELLLQIPTVKYDVTRPIDVIEEILRIYSFDKIPVPQMVNSVLQLNKLQSREMRKKRITSFLVDNGFYEAYHLSFQKEAENKLINPTESGVKVLNPLSADLEYLRTSTLIPGLKSVAHNLNRQLSDVRLFKWGTVFNILEENIVEKQTLSFWITGNMQIPNWHTTQQKSDFFFAKAYWEKILQLAGIKNYTSEAFSGDAIYGYGLHYYFKDEKIASVGMVNKQICKETDISQEVFFLEADAAILLNAAKAEMKYAPVSRFPRVERDLSMLVPQNISYAQIREQVNNLQSKILKKLYIFDVYQGGQVQEGFKSYAIRLEFEDNAKTLEDKAVDKVMNNLAGKLETELQIQIRKL